MQGDIADKALLRSIFSDHSMTAVMHFAGFKAVGESVREPLMYYRNNFSGTVSLCEVMNEFGVKRIVFSSSATVYGDPASVPIREDFPTGGTTNPYGTSKYMVERLLADLCIADPAYALERLGWRAELSLDAMLRDTWRWQSQNPDGYDKS